MTLSEDNRQPERDRPTVRELDRYCSQLHISTTPGVQRALILYANKSTHARVNSNAMVYWWVQV